MTYDATLTITVPAALYDTACSIARSLDPDAGGYSSFGPKVEGATEYTTSTPCTSEFKAQAIQMLADPAVLCHVVSQDYAARWADLEPPTLGECVVFCAGVVVQGDSDGGSYVLAEDRAGRVVREDLQLEEPLSAAEIATVESYINSKTKAY